MNDELQHPAFPPPPHPDVVLWRYLDAYKFEWLVHNRRLYMPSASSLFLNDPLEGTEPSGQTRFWEQLAENAGSEKQRQVIIRKKKRVSVFSEAFRPNYYLSCWHMNSVESAKMWKEYTQTSRAVAVTTSYRTLRGVLPDYVEIGMVRYIDYLNEPLPSLNMFEYITHKNINFCFEREVRAVAFRPAIKELGSAHFQDNLFESVSENGPVIFAPEVEITSLIHGILLHPDSPSDFAEKVRSVCENTGLPSPTRSTFTTSEGGTSS